ncbi:TPA: substrate-binding periplasmic protein [Pseudomonas aeruginosa]
MVVEFAMMKRIILLIVFALWSAIARAENYRVFTEEWAPYNYLEDGELKGVVTEVVKSIMDVTRDEFEITLVPSMRASYALKMRPKSIMFSMFRTGDRERLYKWVGPIVDVSIYPYQLSYAKNRVASFEDLLGVDKITTRSGGLLPRLLRQKGFENLDESASESEQLYLMLLAGRSAVIVGDSEAGMRYYMHKLNAPLSAVRRIPVELFSSSLYIAFSPDCDDVLIKSWSRALEELRKSGKLVEIQKRYEVVY